MADHEALCVHKRLAPRRVILRRRNVFTADPDEQWVLDDASMQSRGHNTPFKNRALKGRVRCTLLGGRIVFESPAA